MQNFYQCIFQSRFLTLLTLFVLSGYSLSASATEQWELAEFSFEANKPIEKPFAVEFGAVFSHSDGQQIKVPGFFNGGKQWTVRFCPQKTGDWEYTTFSSLDEISKQHGKLSVQPISNKSNHGPIKISETDPQKFSYADNTPYFLMAFELDWLFALDAENSKDIPKSREIIKTVADHGYNQIVMNVYAYDADWGEKDKIQPENNYARPSIFPFGGSNESPDYSTLNVEFFKRLDRVMTHLNEKQIVSHLMIYVWNKKVNWPKADSEADNLYFDYIIKRYQAYPNLIWDISKEALGYGHDDMGYVTRRIERLRKLDAHKRLLSVHDYQYCDAFPETVDFISIQEWDSYLYDNMLGVKAKHKTKPIFNIEHGGYEKTIHSIFDGAYVDKFSCLDRTYQCIFAGVYPTYYWQNTAWYNVIADPMSLPKESQPSFAYYKNIQKLFSRYSFQDLEPLEVRFAPPVLTNKKDLYLFYVTGKRFGLFGTFKELEGKMVNIKWFDPFTGKFTEKGKAKINAGAWVYMKRPKEVSEKMSIAILEVIEK